MTSELNNVTPARQMSGRRSKPSMDLLIDNQRILSQYIVPKKNPRIRAIKHNSENLSVSDNNEKSSNVLNNKVELKSPKSRIIIKSSEENISPKILIKKRKLTSSIINGSKDDMENKTTNTDIYSIVSRSPFASLKIKKVDVSDNVISKEKENGTTKEDDDIPLSKMFPDLKQRIVSQETMATSVAEKRVTNIVLPPKKKIKFVNISELNGFQMFPNPVSPAQTVSITTLSPSSSLTMTGDNVIPVTKTDISSLSKIPKKNKSEIVISDDNKDITDILSLTKIPKKSKIKVIAPIIDEIVISDDNKDTIDVLPPSRIPKKNKIKIIAPVTDETVIIDTSKDTVDVSSLPKIPKKNKLKVMAPVTNEIGITDDNKDIIDILSASKIPKKNKINITAPLPQETVSTIADQNKDTVDVSSLPKIPKKYKTKVLAPLTYEIVSIITEDNNDTVDVSSLPKIPKKKKTKATEETVSEVIDDGNNEPITIISDVTVSGPNGNAVVMDTADPSVHTASASPPPPSESDIVALPTVCPRRCVRHRCTNVAIEDSRWDREFCSPDCAVMHTKTVFTEWLQSQRDDSELDARL